MVSEPAQIAPAPLALPVPGEAGFQARVAVGHGPDTDDKWIDLFAAGTSEGARVACEQGAKNVTGFWEREVGASLIRPCAVEPLPGLLQRGAPHTLFIHEQASEGYFLAMQDLLASQPDPSAESVPELPLKITAFTRLDSAEECQTLIERVVQHNAEAAREAASASADWLQQQLAENERAREVSCAQADEARSRCAPLRKGTSVAATCEGDPAAIACKQAKRKSEKLMRCEVELKSSERSCENTTKLLEALRTQGVGESPAPEQLNASCIPG